MLKGALLGLVNTVAVAICIAVTMGDPQAFGLVAFIAPFAALPCGAVVGLAARVTEGLAPRARLAILAPAPIGLVFALGHELRMGELAPVSCIPTAVAIAILERWTRRPSPIPVARTV